MPLTWPKIPLSTGTAWSCVHELWDNLVAYSRHNGFIELILSVVCCLLLFAGRVILEDTKTLSRFEWSLKRLHRYQHWHSSLVHEVFRFCIHLSIIYMQEPISVASLANHKRKKGGERKTPRNQPTFADRGGNDRRFRFVNFVVSVNHFWYLEESNHKTTLISPPRE